MPTLPRYYIRTALLWLLAGLTLTGLLLIEQALGMALPLGAPQQALLHMLTVGWATQLIAGVGIWMFPIVSRERPRGNERLLWAAYGLLNLGLLLRCLSEPWLEAGAHSPGGWALAASGGTQMLAIWAIIGALWPRVRARTRRG